MSHVCSANAVVTALTVTGQTFIGTFLGIRHHDDAVNEGEHFLFLRLTVASPPFNAGEVVALNLGLVVAVGPVAAPAIA